MGNILFFHGNGDNVSTQLPNTFWLAKAGYDLYVFDYRGYGQSEGNAELDTAISDMELMIGHVVQQLRILANLITHSGFIRSPDLSNTKTLIVSA